MADHYNQLVGGSSGGHGGSPERGGGSEGIKEQDRLLPIANVGRIMKQILPPNAKVSKEAKETMQECVSEFISFVTGEASDKCHKEKRKTVNGDDVCWAFSALGFDDYVDPMRRYLLKFRELEGDRAAAAASSRGGGMPPDAGGHASGSGAGVGGASGGHFMFDALDRSDNNNAGGSRQF
ncbi:nuclear transcription factor Y subunit B-1-like [Lolium rigidum]|jgi:histone H3/H4|uniref:nuclear transcription factor Y subunit B-1-like n=1 Tax=Lolium rigidum TaxID=89674 RepID=UPI001F5E16C3|nr:nuclear transcription factor Y subunit B-1-like [Lolium rigidum]XP_047056268.1 nuclear transcription factor Y subunit B-1-like [Lolium rigidum]XP_051228007.1 nuclear transcription factor Y subunit B-1-like [Lolium perenne]